MIRLSTSTTLHEMNAVMDRIAEHILQDKAGISYARFIFLFTVEQYGSATQHVVAQAMKVSDPAVSKLCGAAAREGLLRTVVNPYHKRQRLISLTAVGQEALHRGLAALDSCFSAVCTKAGVAEEAYRDQTARLLDSLDAKYKEMVK